jgi:hypothetical protein
VVPLLISWGLPWRGVEGPLERVPLVRAAEQA